MPISQEWTLKDKRNYRSVREIPSRKQSLLLSNSLVYELLVSTQYSSTRESYHSSYCVNQFEGDKTMAGRVKLKQGLHDVICLTDSFTFTPGHCVDF